jgi:hypothetical protein
MALVPVAMRPSFVIRRKAVRQGVLGPSLVWKVVAVLVFGRRTMKSIFGRNPEALDKVTLRTGTHVRVSNIAPTRGLSRRQRRRELARLEAEAHADIAAAGDGV